MLRIEHMSRRLFVTLCVEMQLMNPFGSATV